MNTRDFFYWLRGFLEAGGSDLTKISGKMADVKPDEDCGCKKAPPAPPSMLPTMRQSLVTPPPPAASG